MAKLIRVSLSGDQLILKFNYARDYVERMRSLDAIPHKEGKRWYWTLPVSSFYALEELFKGELVFETERHVILGEPPPGQPEHILRYSEDPLPGLTKLDLLPHQCRAVRFQADRLLTTGFALNQDGVGLGKTAEALGTAEYLRQSGHLQGPVLVICLASLKNQWLEDGVEKFTWAKGIVMKHAPAQRRRIYQSWTEYDYFIINYELVLRDIDELAKIPWGLMICDEPHEKILNPDGKTHRAIKSLNVPMKLFLTATPLNNSPIELFAVFQIGDPGVFGKRREFEKRYVRYDYSNGYPRLIGYRHLDELKEKIQPYVIRRTWEDAGISFPEVQRIERRMKATRKQLEAFEKITEYRYYLLDRRAELFDKEHKTRQDWLELQNLDKRIQSLAVYELMLSDWPDILLLAKNKYIREEVAPIVEGDVSPKYEMLLDTLLELRSEKAVVFTESKKVARRLLRGIRQHIGYAVPYWGDMSDEKRAKAKRLFNEDPDTRVMVATSAGYTGLNLPAGSICIHYDLPWAPTRMEQREGRLTRLDSKHSRVLSYIFLIKDLGDEHVYETVIKKKAVFDFLVG